jgi:hypothetical protein
MPKSRKFWLAVSFLAIGLLLYFGYRTYDLTRPLPSEPAVTFTLPNASTVDLKAFLAGDFVVVHRMRLLPPSVQGVFTEKGGHRRTMADPNEDFQATDVISMPGMPRKRLIFAGVSGDKCFVHFAAGGIAHSYEVALFRLSQANAIEPIWAGYCGEAKNLTALRNQIEHGDCQSQ